MEHQKGCPTPKECMLRRANDLRETVLMKHKGRIRNGRELMLAYLLEHAADNWDESVIIDDQGIIVNERRLLCECERGALWLQKPLERGQDTVTYTSALVDKNPSPADAKLPRLGNFPGKTDEG